MDGRLSGRRARRQARRARPCRCFQEDYRRIADAAEWRATTIIPLSATRFVVVQNGGGSTYIDELAKTVAPVRADIDPAAKAAALQAEAAAYKKQQ